MKRIFKTSVCLLIIEVCGFNPGSNFHETTRQTTRILLADPPDDDDEIEPPDDPIVNSPIPPDTVIFGSYGEPVKWDLIISISPYKKKGGVKMYHE